MLMVQTAWSQAVARGVAYLRKAQRDDGSWHDFDLPVGASDQWLTGFVGSHLQQAGEGAAVPAAAAWLAAQPGAGRWGFNRDCEPDADSTAWAAMCLRQGDASGGTVDWDWLWQHRKGGGFATYLANDGWGDAHDCVTPIVWLALPAALQRDVADACRSHLQRARRADGSWAGYWWSSAHYPTLWAVRALATMGARPRAPRGGWCEVPSLGTLHSAAELAWLLDLCANADEPAPRGLALVRALLALQRADGSWPPSRCLRVTPHWQHGSQTRDDPGEGQLFADGAGLLTTAAAVLALRHAQQAWP